MEKAKPVLKKLPGWKCDIRGIRKYEDLPENCRKYIEFVESEIGYPITMSPTDQAEMTSFTVRKRKAGARSACFFAFVFLRLLLRNVLGLFYNIDITWSHLMHIIKSTTI